MAELPLDHDAAIEKNLRWAHARAGIAMPFEQAIADPLIGLCLRNAVSAARKGRRA